MLNGRTLPPVAATLLALAGGFGLAAPERAGPLLLFVGPALFPGLVVAACCLPGARALERWTVGAALSPLVCAIVGWAGVRLGFRPGDVLRSLVVVSMVAALAIELALARRPWIPPDRDQARARRAAALLVALGVGAIALPLLFNRWLLVRSDAWVHGALTWELLLRGFPPQDTWFAGIALNYVWFFNWFLALLVASGGHDPFVFMGCFNAVNVGLFLSLVYRLALAAGQRPRAAAWSVALVMVGLNAGAWILWPIRGLRGLTGDVRGWQAILQEYHVPPVGTFRILYDLSAPFAYMVNLFDKFYTGTALSYAWLLLLVLLIGWLRHVQGGRRGWLALGALASLGMLLFHGVVGMSALPTLLGASGLALVLARDRPWLGSRARMGAYAAAALAGALLGVPYTYSIARGWAPDVSGLRHSYLVHDPFMAWTLLTATGVVLAMAIRPVRDAWRGRGGPLVLLALWTLCMYVFGALVSLPERNESKFVFQAFFGVVIFAGAGAPRTWQWARERMGPRRAALLAALLFLVGPVLTVHGFAADPSGRSDPTFHVPPGDAALHAFLRDHTPLDAVIVDRGYHDWVMVPARRRMYCGRPEGPDKFGWPADQVAERHRVIDDLYGLRRDVARDVASLDGLHAPVYVVDRPPLPGQPTLAPLDSLSARFRRVYDRDGRVLYRLAP